MKLLNFIKKYRHSALVVIDIGVIICSYIASILFLEVPINSIIDFIKEMSIVVLIYQLFLNLFQMYKDMIRYEIGKDYVKYMLIVLISMVTVMTISQVLHLGHLTIRVNVLSGIFIAGVLVIYRLAARSIVSRMISMKKNQVYNENCKLENLLIIGAGNGAREIIIAINSKLKAKYNIVGAVDDSPNKLYKNILGVKVLGTRYDIPEIVKEKNVDIIFFAIDNISKRSRKHIIEICQTTGIKTRVLPSTEEMIKKRWNNEQLKRR